mgnify:CR=1 FL=1
MRTRRDLLTAARGVMGLLKWAHVAATIALVFGLAYYLGHNMLSGSLKGNDSAMHVAYALWVDEYFPNLPHWYPLQGGGESIVHGYPLLGHVLVVVTSRVANLSIVQAFRLVSFLSFPLAAMGIYFFCWKALKRQSVGLLAAIFYLLAPLTWTWTYDWGFFGQGVGFVFVPFTLICFDGYLSHRPGATGRGGRRLWQAGMILGLILSMLCHPVAGAGAILGMAAFTVLSALVAERGGRSRILAQGARGIISGGVLAALTLAAYLLPLYSYGQIANREGLNVLGLHQLPRISIPEFLGLRQPNPLLILSRMANPLAVTVFLPVAIVLAGRTSRTALAWSLTAGLVAFPAVLPEIPEALSAGSSLLALVFSFRSALVLVMVLFPAVAAYGVWALADLIVSIMRGDSQERSDQAVANWPWLDLWSYASSVTAVLMAMLVVFQVGRAISGEPYRLGYGPTPAGIDFRDIWSKRATDACLGADQTPLASGLCELPEARAKLNIQEFLQECNSVRDLGLESPTLCQSTAPSLAEFQAFLTDCDLEADSTAEANPCNARVQSGLAALLLRPWPSFDLSDEDPSIARSQMLARQLPDQPMLRIDVSPLEGRLAQDITTYSNASQVEAYTQQLSLIHLMWGYQLGVFYSDEYGSPSALNDLADWMGINYVFLDPKDDPVEKYVTAGWSKTYADADVELWRNSASPPLATASTNPAILVITDPSSGSFAQLFRLANEGLAPHSEYSLVEGRPSVEHYSLDDLRRFDIIFLHGYQYRNSEEAWELLGDYVRLGGSLFVDTGWQFVVPEWEFEIAPEVLPVSRLTWTDYGKQNTYKLDSSSVAGEVSLEGFGPLIWEDDPWGVSGASSGDLREWAQPVLSVGDNPLIAAGEYGDGRVIWSGMNLLSHMVAYASQEEALLLHNLLSWLAEGKQGTELTHPSVARDHPDRVWFSVATQAADVTWLYWREAFYPNWHAYLAEGAGEREVPIYRAGPGFMLMPLGADDPQASVTLQWELPLVEKAAVLVSIAGALFLAGLVVDGLLLQGNGFTWLKIGLVMRIPKPFLGEGSNREWAERKRAELEAGQLSPDTPPHLVPSQAISWWRDDQDAKQVIHGGDAQQVAATTQAGDAPHFVSASYLPADRDGQGEVSTSPTPAAGDGHQPEAAPAIEPPSDETERALLESWLNGSGHSDDAWAEKLLGRKNNSLEA